VSCRSPWFKLAVSSFHLGGGLVHPGEGTEIRLPKDQEHNQSNLCDLLPKYDIGSITASVYTPTCDSPRVPTTDTVSKVIEWQSQTDFVEACPDKSW